MSRVVYGLIALGQFIYMGLQLGNYVPTTPWWETLTMLAVTVVLTFSEPKEERFPPGPDPARKARLP